MKSLTQYLHQNSLDPVLAMNWLQERNLVADSAVTSDDVAEADAFPAMKALKRIGNSLDDSSPLAHLRANERP